MNAPSLPPGFRLRAACWDDLPALVDLIRVVYAEQGDLLMADTLEDLQNQWSRPGRSLQTDAWAVVTDEGRLVGYEEGMDRCRHSVLSAGGYVHPDFCSLGIGTLLLRRLEQWAGEHVRLADPQDEALIMMGGINADHATSLRLLEGEGYHPARYFWRMGIDLPQAPPAPVLPPGIEFRPLEVDLHLQAVYQADEEAFEDHWGHYPTSFEAWRHRRIVEHSFNPDFWHIAWDGKDVAGFSLGHPLKNIGWISNLGVRRPWRKRGLGLALLLQSFAAFHRRGFTTVGLGVDAESPTGATRLYEKAGMRVVQKYVTCEKQLRPGRRISVQSQEED